MKRRALIVDDTELNRKLAIAILRREGWEVEQAASGKEALARIEAEGGFDIILLDIRMPDMSGEEVCTILRADPRTAALPLVAYTAHALEDELESFLALGFNAVLIKPITVEALKGVLSRTLEGRDHPIGQG